MKPFVAIAAARFRLLLQYRAAALAGVGTQLFFGAIMCAVMETFYASSPSKAPLSLPQVIAYIWLGQAFFALLPWRADPDVKALINSGGLAYELARPLDLYTLWYARSIALKTAPVFLRAVPQLIIAGLFLGLPAPASWSAALLWLLAVCGAFAMASAFTVLMNISLLWTLSAEGIHFLAPAVLSILTGALVPIPLLPPWSQPLLAALPFRGMMDTPHRVWLGELAGAEALLALAHQWAWIFLLVLIGRSLLARGLRRVVIQGG